MVKIKLNIGYLIIISDSKPKTAFLVTLDTNSNLKLGKNTVVKFDTVITNEGNGYDITTGIFTAPVGGLYEISANFLSMGESWLELNLIKNDQVIVRGHAAHDHGTAGSLQAVLRLEKSDKIFLRHPRSSATLGGYR